MAQVRTAFILAAVVASAPVPAPAADASLPAVVRELQRTALADTRAYGTAWGLAEGPALQPLARTWPAPADSVHPCEWRP